MGHLGEQRNGEINKTGYISVMNLHRDIKNNNKINMLLISITVFNLSGCLAVTARSGASSIEVPGSDTGEHASAKPAGASLYKFETSAFMRDYAYGRPDRAYQEANANGAYGAVNRRWDSERQGSWYIEEQRYGADAIAVGLAHNRSGDVQRGVLILNWGWARQEPDGSFACHDNIHSTMFFVEAVARAALLIEASYYRQQYAGVLAEWRPHLQAAVRWLMQPEIELRGMARDAPYTHRGYRNAVALLAAGIWLDDSEAIARSRMYLHDAVMRQDPTGFNPEKGGHDTSYHGVGLLYAARYYALISNIGNVADDDAVFREELKASVLKALTWLRVRISSDGVISAEGNTRTGGDQEVSRSGKTKAISYSYTYKALHFWGELLHLPDLTALAKRVHSKS